MRAEFPRGFEGTENLPETNRDLRNCFNNGNNVIITRPGVASISTPSGVARGGFEWNGSLYEVYSGDLIRITDVTTGAFTTVGVITGSDNIKFAIGFNTAVILVPDGEIYTLDKLDAVVVISGNANFVPCVDVTHINGRFVYIPTDGDPAFFSDVGAAGTVQVLSFFDAENLPDKNNVCFNLRETLYIGGTDSFQPFRDTGASPVPFVGTPGSRILNGFIGGLQEFGDTFLFVGKEKDQDQGIYNITQGGARKISNERIDLLLSTYEVEELEKIKTQRFKWRGYDIVTFKLSLDSFGFAGGNWFTLDTVINDVSRPWSADFITEFEKTYFVANNDSFGKLDKVNTDFGSKITRIIRMSFEQEDGDDFSFQSLELGISQGFNPSTGFTVGSLTVLNSSITAFTVPLIVLNSSLDEFNVSSDALNSNGSTFTVGAEDSVNPAGSVGLRTSDDNVLFGDYAFEETGAVGEYGKKLVWNYPGGLGTYPGFMGIELYTTDDIEFSSSYIILK